MDAVGLRYGDLYLAGVGELRPIKPEAESAAKGEQLIWLGLPFGQTILARVWIDPVQFKDVEPRARRSPDEHSNARKTIGRLPDLFSQKADKPASVESGKSASTLSLDEALQQIISSGFDPEVIGRYLLARAGRRDFVEQGIALAATTLTAYEARRRKLR